MAHSARTGGTATLTARLVSRYGAVAIACVLGLLVLLAGAAITWHSSTTYGHAAKGHSRDVGSIPTAAPSAAAQQAVVFPLSPTRIDIPKLEASAPIVKVATGSDGELEVPQNPRTVGWWSPGARPGAQTGTAILAGHINYAGVDGTFSRIGKLAPGDTFTVHGTGVNAKKQKAVTFQVTGIRTYHKTRLPYKQIFDQKSLGRVALVTCGGPFDNATGNYLDNIVVFGVPVSVA